MKKMKRLTSLAVGIVLLLAMLLQLVACNTTTGPTDETTIGTEDPGVNPDGTTQYTISVGSVGGLKLSGIMTYIYNEEGYIVAKNPTDDNGNVSFSLPTGGKYQAELSGIPDGYNVQEKYDISAGGNSIMLTSSVIADTDLTGVTYKAGMIMHDFEFTTSDGKTLKLSELLKTKKAVMLNFWYITCSWCVEEFPGMNSAYLKYKDDLEILAINNYSSDSVADIQNFKTGYYEGLELAFPMGKDPGGIEDAFEVPGNPVSVMIDRYGMISIIKAGAINESQFDKMFSVFTADDYKQGIYNDISELVPTEKPNIEMPSNEQLSAALNSGNIKVTYSPETETADAEYSWPYAITKKNNVTCIEPTNSGKDVSFATLHAKVELKKGEAFVFDYFASCEAGYDIMYVLVDKNDIYQISGVESEWKECCPWVADADGTYDVIFLYNKNSSGKEGDDKVYLKNFRTMNASEVKPASYIPREASTNQTEDKSDYQNYVNVVLSDVDGYYHVGTKDGPILLAKLIYGTNFSDTSVAENLYAGDKFMVGGKDCYDDLERYCNYAANSKIYTYCSVDASLRTYLEEYVKLYGHATHENTWLQLCAYYDVYGLDESGKQIGQLEDPIKGLSAHSAYVAVEGNTNQVKYEGLSMIPRGYLYKFVPTKTGVYRVTSFNTDQEVIGWIFAGGDAEWIANGDRILYTSSDEGERFCRELIIEKEVIGDDGNKKTELVMDQNNCSMVAYMEAGTAYYIDIAYYDIYGEGTFNFDIKYLGESYGYFISGSSGPFTFELNADGTQGDIVAGAIDVMLGNDGYYYHKKADGSQGSKIYADFHMITSVFTSNSLIDMIDKGAYNFALSELDHMAIADWEKAGKNEDKLRQMWGADAEANWVNYKMDDIIKGVYHGNGQDMTEVVRGYLTKVLEDPAYAERQGCVEVDAQLMQILQQLMDKYTFPGVERSWLKLCYYYSYLGK